MTAFSQYAVPVPSQHARMLRRAADKRLSDERHKSATMGAGAFSTCTTQFYNGGGGQLQQEDKCFSVHTERAPFLKPAKVHRHRQM